MNWEKIARIAWYASMLALTGFNSFLLWCMASELDILIRKSQELYDLTLQAWATFFKMLMGV